MAPCSSRGLCQSLGPTALFPHAVPVPEPPGQTGVVTVISLPLLWGTHTHTCTLAASDSPSRSPFLSQPSPVSQERCPHTCSRVLGARASRPFSLTLSTLFHQACRTSAATAALHEVAHTVPSRHSPDASVQGSSSPAPSPRPSPPHLCTCTGSRVVLVTWSAALTIVGLSNGAGGAVPATWACTGRHAYLQALVQRLSPHSLSRCFPGTPPPFPTQARLPLSLAHTASPAYTRDRSFAHSVSSPHTCSPARGLPAASDTHRPALSHNSALHTLAALHLQSCLSQSGPMASGAKKG